MDRFEPNHEKPDYHSPDDEQDMSEYSLLDLARIKNGFYVKPRSKRTIEELDFEEAYGFLPDDMPEGWENWGIDPDTESDAWDMPDSWWEN